MRKMLGLSKNELKSVVGHGYILSLKAAAQTPRIHKYNTAGGKQHEHHRVLRRERRQ